MRIKAWPKNPYMSIAQQAGNSLNSYPNRLKPILVLDVTEKLQLFVTVSEAFDSSLQTKWPKPKKKTKLYYLCGYCFLLGERRDCSAEKPSCAEGPIRVQLSQRTQQLCSVVFPFEIEAEIICPLQESLPKKWQF
eukprot:c941_g1_i1 orf=1-402(-)